MENKLRTYTFLLLTTLNLNAQIITNGSFETNYTKPWTTCGSSSTPDIQPGQWSVYTPPSDGNNYISLVIRGDTGSSTNLNEQVQIKLNEPLNQYGCYQISVDLAHSKSFGLNYLGNWMSYANPTKLNIYASDGNCNKKELLWSSPPILHDYWKQYDVNFTPTSGSYSATIIESQYTTINRYFGNVLVDNLSITKNNSLEESASIIKMDTIVKRGETITLSASQSEFITWTPDNELSCSNCNNPNVTVNYSNNYLATIHYNEGCTKKELFKITMDPTVPKVINNNTTENLTIENLSPNTHLIVFNRWGNVIFESENYEDDWNLREQNGKKLSPGTYFYSLDPANSKTKKNGFIQIVN